MAKIRLTIMTENDKHIDEKYSVEKIEALTKKSWEWIFNTMINPLSSDKATVEKCELVER